MSEVFYQPQGNVAPVKLAFVELKEMSLDLEFGIAPKEQGHKQRILVDVEIGFDDAKTSITDDEDGLRHGFDYTPVHAAIKRAAYLDAKSEPRRIHLLETLANRVADQILAIHGAYTVAVKVTKTRVWSDVETVTLKISRKR